MKSFVRNMEEDRRAFILIGVLTIAIFLLANAIGELVYLPLILLFSFQQAREYLRQRTEKRAKALLDADRSTGSR
jgi:hypothetical protein